MSNLESIRLLLVESFQTLNFDVEESVIGSCWGWGGGEGGNESYLNKYYISRQKIYPSSSDLGWVITVIGQPRNVVR